MFFHLFIYLYFQLTEFNQLTLIMNKKSPTMRLARIVVLFTCINIIYGITEELSPGTFIFHYNLFQINMILIYGKLLLKILYFTEFQQLFEFRQLDDLIIKILKCTKNRRKLNLSKLLIL